jgi:hypothetical protein
MFALERIGLLLTPRENLMVSSAAHLCIAVTFWFDLQMHGCSEFYSSESGVFLCMDNMQGCSAHHAQSGMNINHCQTVHTHLMSILHAYDDHEYY